MLFNPTIHHRKEQPSKLYSYSRSVHIERAVSDVFRFCLDGENFKRIVPNRVEAVKETDETFVREGHVYPFRQWTAGLPMRWTMYVVEVVPNQMFVDELLEGPMRYLRHRHLFRSEGTGTLYTDHLEYLPHLGPLLQHLFVARQMRRTFEYRHEKMKRLLETAGAEPETSR